MCRTSFVSCISIQLLLLLMLFCTIFFPTSTRFQFHLGFVVSSICVHYVRGLFWHGAFEQSLAVLRATIIFTFILFTYSMGRENNALKMDCAICFLVFLFSFVGYYIWKVRIRKQKTCSVQPSSTVLRWTGNAQSRTLQEKKSAKDIPLISFVFFYFISLRSSSIKNWKVARLRSRSVAKKKLFRICQRTQIPTVFNRLKWFCRLNIYQIKKILWLLCHTLMSIVCIMSSVGGTAVRSLQIMLSKWSQTINNYKTCVHKLCECCGWACLACVCRWRWVNKWMEQRRNRAKRIHTHTHTGGDEEQWWHVNRWWSCRFTFFPMCISMLMLTLNMIHHTLFCPPQIYYHFQFITLFSLRFAICWFYFALAPNIEMR